jgi:hypothetical protein
LTHRVILSHRGRAPWNICGKLEYILSSIGIQRVFQKRKRCVMAARIP